MLHFPKKLSLITSLATMVATAGMVAPTTIFAAGEVSFIQAVEPQGLDPTVGSPVAVGEITWQNIFEGLVTISANGTVEAQLATDWTISEDGLTYTFNLRPDVTFHNGQAFDSATAKFTIDRIISEDSTNGQKKLYTAIETVDAPDASTLVLHLSKPSSDLIYWLGFPAAVMLDPSSIATNGSDPIGTGPFKMDEWRKGDRVIMSAYPDYWGDAVALDKITARFIADPQAQVAALKSGQVQVASVLGAAELFDQFTKDDKFTAVVGAGEREVVAGMNNAREPFNDIRVRQALMKAIDRTSLIAAAQSGYGTPIGTHFSPASPFYKDLSGEYTYDPEAAKALLAEAGYADGFEFTFKVPNRTYAQRTAEIMQAYFQQIGVTANIVNSDFPAAWIQEVFKDTDYDMTIIGHSEPLDIGIYARDPYYFNYENPAFNDVMTKVALAADETERAAGYQKAQEIVATDLPALFLYSSAKLGVWDAKLEGLWKNGPVPSNDMTDVHWTE